MSGLATLSEAISWARDHWMGRDLPVRIHDRGIEPDSVLGSPHMTEAMMRYLMARPDDMAGEANRYRYPMWRALSRLARIPDEPSPAIIVTTLFARGWDVERLAVEERVVLRCLRQLHRCYEETPIPRVSWVDRSESQRMAEEAAA